MVLSNLIRRPTPKLRKEQLVAVADLDLWLDVETDQFASNAKKLARQFAKAEVPWLAGWLGGWVFGRAPECGMGNVTRGREWEVQNTRESQNGRLQKMGRKTLSATDSVL